MKNFLLLPLLLILGIGFGVIWLYFNTQPVSSNKTFSNFLIAKGSSASQIGAKLESSGFVRSALVFRIYLKATGQDSKIQAGEFRLSPSFNLFQTVDALFKGPVEIWVTVPEGLRREEIAQKFTSGLDRDQAFTNEFLQASRGQEGMLFPDTYLFPKEASASAIVSKMTRTFVARTKDLEVSANLTFDQKLVLASIIERETKNSPAERPMVAGILLNRIEVGMPLQVDATVQYAIANDKCQMTNVKCDWWPILSREDLKINSKFNTYKFTGLPPSPIASPGLTALTAAFSPQSNDYFYYIHDSEGKIHYAKTLEEHNQNIRTYLGK